MFITIEQSRVPDLIPHIRPGDRVECIIDKFKVKLFCDIQEVTETGVHAKLSNDRNHLFERLHGWAYTKQLKDEVYFITWEKIDSIYMKG